MLNDTNWAFSNEEPTSEFTDPVEGLQYLIVKKAEYNDDTSQYMLTLESLTNNAYLNLRYWLMRVNKETGMPEPDAAQRRTLISLKKALYGPEAVGIPNPMDIVGCAVLAEVQLSKPNDNGKRYPRIYNYKPVPEGVAKDFGNPEQYSLPEEEQ
jgi:hypothetical protein